MADFSVDRYPPARYQLTYHFMDREPPVVYHASSEEGARKLLEEVLAGPYPLRDWELSRVERIVLDHWEAE